MGIFSKAIIAEIISEVGNTCCHYCKKPTRINHTGVMPQRPDHATLDHIVPKSKGGTNARANLVLACNACNNAKGDRSYEDFLERPYRLSAVAPVRHQEDDGKPVRIRYGSRVIVPVCKPKKPVEHPAMKVRKGTLASAIRSGEVSEAGFYQGTPSRQLVGEPRSRIDPIPYHETMYILTGKKVPKRSEIFDAR